MNLIFKIIILLVITFPMLGFGYFSSNCDKNGLDDLSSCDVLITLDAGIFKITEPIGLICGTNIISPVVELKNFGTDTLYSVGINYSVDGGANNVFNWSGILIPGAIKSVFLTNMTLPLGAHTFSVFTANPNGSTDLNTANDIATSDFELMQFGVISGAGVPDSVAACPNQPVYLTAFGGIDYYWYGEDSISDPYTATIEVVVDTTTIYYVDISTSGGCYQYDSTVVFVNLTDCGLGIIENNVFSPNGDGVNENFIMDIPQLLSNNNTVKIYNRWGDVIREFVNYNNNDVIWDGKNKDGEFVSSGTYFYVVEIPEVNYGNSGWIEVVR